MYVEPTLNRGNTKALYLRNLGYTTLVFPMQRDGENSNCFWSLEYTILWIKYALNLSCCLLYLLIIHENLLLLKILQICFGKNISQSSNICFLS